MVDLASRRREIGRCAAAAFGGAPSAHRYWDDARGANVDIVRCAGAPRAGFSSYATVGVSEAPLFADGRELDIRAELVGACADEDAAYPNILASVAFCVLNASLFVAPGVIVPDLLAMNPGVSRSMRHVLLLPPSPWEGRLKPLPQARLRIAWLLVLPISQEELELASTEGVPTLERAIERAGVDIFDLQRASVV